MKRREFVVAAALGAGAPAALARNAMPDPAQSTRPAAPPASTAPPRILVVSAHPADFCSRSGGTLIKHVKAGSKVKVIWLTQGENDESAYIYQQHPGISVDEVRKAREKEAFAAAAVVGAEGKMFGWGDGPLRMTPERMEMLAQEMADFKPDIIFTHYKDELSYPTHWRTSHAAIEAAQLARVTWDIHMFEPNVGTASRVGFAPDHYVDISDVFTTKVEALKKLTAQPWLVEEYTACNRWRGIEAHTQYAEGFKRWCPSPPVYELLTPTRPV